MTPEVKKRIDQIRNGIVPEGYKKTGVGIVPSVWKIYSLDTFMGSLEAGTSVNSAPNGDTGFYILKTSSVHNGKVELEKSKSVLPADIERLRCPVTKGCLIISRMNTPELVGECGLVSKSSNVHFLPDRLWKASNISPESCDFIWLNQVLNYARYKFIIHSMATGTSNSMKNISKESFLRMVVACPAFYDQQRIAEILTTQDKVIELKEKLLAEKRRQKKYLMQQLLTGKKHLPGVESEWKTDKLGKLFVERVETKCEHMELLAITGTQGVIPRSWLDLKDNSSDDKSKYLHICIGDIGYNTMRMWQGVSAYSNYEGIVSPAYTILKPKEDICAKYFSYLFKLPEVVFLFYRFSQGLVDDTRNLKYENFKKIKVKFPIDKREQEAISKVLETADKEIDLLQRDLEQEKQKKKTLMQLLLTGIVRV